MKVSKPVVWKMVPVLAVVALVVVVTGCTNTPSNQTTNSNGVVNTSSPDIVQKQIDLERCAGFITTLDDISKNITGYEIVDYNVKKDSTGNVVFPDGSKRDINIKLSGEIYFGYENSWFFSARTMKMTTEADYNIYSSYMDQLGEVLKDFSPTKRSTTFFGRDSAEYLIETPEGKLIFGTHHVIKIPKMKTVYYFKYLPSINHTEAHHLTEEYLTNVCNWTLSE